jgi:hypothetical protein
VNRAACPRQKTGTRRSRSSWLVARIKVVLSLGAKPRSEVGTYVIDLTRPKDHERNAEPHADKNVRATRTYAVRRGLTVKSLTWARMLDICIPFSWLTKGSISAINWSCMISRISS